MGLGKPPRLKQEQRVAAGSRTNAAVASRGGLCRRDHGGGRADHRLRSAVGLHRHPRYLSEQFPTALRGRGHIFGESVGRLFAGGFAPFLIEPHTGWRRSSSTRYLWSWRSAPSFRYSLAARPVGQLETVTEGVPALA